MEVKGNYYIRVRKTGWFVWYQHYKDGKRIQERVADTSLKELGFRKEMSVDQAKARCKQLNKERALIKEKVRLAGKRVEQLKSLDDVLFPAHYITEFEQLLDEENFGSKEHLAKLFSHFAFVQRMCIELQIVPFEYKDSARRIYKYFVIKQVSVNYASRLIKLLNRWGRFYCKKAGKYFEEVKQPGGRERSAIADSQAEKSGTETERGVRMESAPLTALHLANSVDKIDPMHYSWLYISVWLGLRPEEVDSLHDPKNYKIQTHPTKQVQYIEVYQSKLMSVARDKRWKRIPLLFKEQQAVVDIIKSGAFRRPGYKTMRKYMGGNSGITLYGGRKAFTDLMQSRGQNIEDISMWLGHTDLSTTYRHYKERNELSFTPVNVKSIRKHK